MKNNETYEYYHSIRNKAFYIFNKHNLLLYIPNLNIEDYYYQLIVYKEKFYNFLLDLLNKEIYRT